MTNPNPEVAAVAERLSAAQKRAFPILPNEPTCMLPIELSRITRDRLVDKGILTKTRPTGFGMVSWQLSPFGTAVRSYLLSQEAGEGSGGSD